MFSTFFDRRNDIVGTFGQLLFVFIIQLEVVGFDCPFKFILFSLVIFKFFLYVLLFFLLLLLPIPQSLFIIDVS
jgi:hypothetical protein